MTDLGLTKLEFFRFLVIHSRKFAIIITNLGFDLFNLVLNADFFVFHIILRENLVTFVTNFALFQGDPRKSYGYQIQILNLYAIFRLRAYATMFYVYFFFLKKKVTW